MPFAAARDSPFPPLEGTVGPTLARCARRARTAIGTIITSGTPRLGAPTRSRAPRRRPSEGTRWVARTIVGAMRWSPRSRGTTTAGRRSSAGRKSTPSGSVRGRARTGEAAFARRTRLGGSRLPTRGSAWTPSRSTRRALGPPTRASVGTPSWTLPCPLARSPPAASPAGTTAWPTRSPLRHAPSKRS